MIHVCYELTDSTGHYSKFVGTSMLSMFENTKSEITVHILHDNTLTADNREKMISVANRYDQRVEFYNVEKLCSEDIAVYKKYLSEFLLERFSLASMYRLLAHKVTDNKITKIIHLDADTIVNLDIKELYEIELGEKVLAGVPEILCNNGGFDRIHELEALCNENIVKIENYFNSGVLLMNLEHFRNTDENIWYDSIKFVLRNYNRLTDQNILNYCYSEQTILLPERFNCWVREKRAKDIYELKPNIYHYLSNVIELDTRDIYNRIFFKYFMQTPWFDESIFANISAYLDKMRDEQQKIMIRVTAALAGKERAFFTEHCNIEPVKKTFLIRDGEEIFATAANEDFGDSINNKSDSVIKLLESMKKSAGKKFYFLLVGGHYDNLCPILEAEGFVENEDFTDGQLFRSQSSGEPLNTYPIVKAL